MEPPDTPFWRNVERFRAMGLDPLRWIAGCSVAVDDELVLYPGLSAARPALEGMGVTVDSPAGPASVDYRGEPLAVERVIVDPDVEAAPYAAHRGNPRWASVLARVDRPAGDDPRGFAEAILRAMAGVPREAARAGLQGRFDRPTVVGSLEAHATARSGASFFAFDFCDPGSGPTRGRSLVKGQGLEVTDAALDPFDPLHVRGALAAALAPLTALGCWQGLRAWPVLDAPTQRERSALRGSFDAAARAVGVHVEDAPGPGTGALFIGATVAGVAEHDLPNRHQDVAEGMEVLITRPFGDLAPLLVRLMAMSEEELMGRAEQAGFGSSELERLASETHRALTTPDLAVARAIADHRPPQGEPIDPARHIAATVDLSLEGVVGLIRFARRWGVAIRLDELPLAHAALSRFATAEFLTDNATANAPGAVAVVGYPTAMEQVEGDLEAAGTSPLRVGEVTDTGGAVLAAPQALREFVGARRLLEGVAFMRAP